MGVRSAFSDNSEEAQRIEYALRARKTVVSKVIDVSLRERLERNQALGLSLSGLKPAKSPLTNHHFDGDTIIRLFSLSTLLFLATCGGEIDEMGPLG